MPEFATLSIEYFPMTIPKPGGIHVRVNGETIAFVSAEEFERVAKQWEEMAARRREYEAKLKSDK